MPILEAMACGLPPVVPIGGPSDDFVDETCGYPLPAAEVPTEHPEALAGPALEFKVDLQQLKGCLRSAATARDTTRRRGDEAALRVRGRYSWKATATAMERRILALASEPPAIGQTADAPLPVSLCIQGCGDALELAQVLGRCGPYVGETFVELAPDREELCQIAGEYAATVIPPSRDTAGEFALLSRFEYRMALPSEAQLQPHDWLALRRAITTSEVDPGRALTMTLVCGTHVELFRKVADRPHAQ